MRVFFAILVARLIKLVCKIVHRGGTAKPGEIAMKICPNILRILSKNTKCVIITGTNGKTTSTRMVEEGFAKAGLNYFSNRSGANLTAGIVTDFISNSTIGGKCLKEYAVLECDEAASKKVCLMTQPIIIFVTNLFRDQVDRFGGVVNTRNEIRIGIMNAPNALLVLNGDCPVCVSLSEEVPNRSVFFGIGASAAAECGDPGTSDLTECIDCGAEYEYGYRTFSHLGGYLCPSCGKHRPAVDYEVKEITTQDLSHSDVVLAYPGGETEMSINLPAVYNIYNAAGSFAALLEAGISREDALSALGSFQCGFGRMEYFNMGKKGARMILVKNDAGCNQVLRFLRKVDEDFVLSIYLNNNISDGVDISWLDSTDFELLNDCRVSFIYVSGMRADEMYARLLRAGIPEEKMKIERSCSELIRQLGESEDTVFIMPTYTGMMETRSEIIRRYGGNEFWET